jgi:hypothetical protein
MIAQPPGPGINRTYGSGARNKSGAVDTRLCLR